MPDPAAAGDDPAYDLSVVLATEDARTIERTLASLRAQTGRDRLEVVLVSLSGEALRLESAQLEGFGGHQLVDAGAPLSLAAGRAFGVRAAHGRYVHIGETHAFPHPDWAERIIESFDERWSAIVSGIENANPDGAISWANLLIDYGPWLTYRPAGEIESSPPYNTAFERSFALRALELTPDAFAPGYDLAALFRRGGHRILFQPAATVAHVNVSLASHWLHQRFTAAQMHAGLRSGHWSRSRRLVYVLGSPLIPAVLATRIAPFVVAARREWKLPFLTAPAILLGLVARATGEAAGFAFGADEKVAHRADSYELHKVRYTVIS